jgi:hypothetical protein
VLHWVFVLLDDLLFGICFVDQLLAERGIQAGSLNAAALQPSGFKYHRVHTPRVSGVTATCGLRTGFWRMLPVLALQLTLTCTYQVALLLLLSLLLRR